MFIPDVYKDVSYVLDDDSYASAEYNDVVRKRFIKAWEGLVEGYKVRDPLTTLLSVSATKVIDQDIFAETNFRLFFGLALDVLVRPWEKFVMALRYSEVSQTCSFVFAAPVNPYVVCRSSAQSASIAISVR